MACYDRSAFVFEGHVRESPVIGPEWATTECRVHVCFNERNIITHLTRARASGPSLGKIHRRGARIAVSATRLARRKRSSIVSWRNLSAGDVAPFTPHLV